MDEHITNQNDQPKQAMNPMIIGVVVIGIVLVGVYALFGNKDATSQTRSSVTQSPSVTIQPDATNTPVTNGVKEFTMTAKKFDFSPATITVSEGDNIKLTVNNLDVPHGFAIDELGIKKDLPVGTTVVEFTATKKGTFRFYCSLFCGQGHKEMEGKLIVE